LVESTLTGTDGVDVTKLNELGRRRVERGFECFVHPSVNGGLEATCADFGLSARGNTIDEARAELERVLLDALSIASDHRFLEEMLNRPSNPAAVRYMRRWLRVWHIAEAVMSPIFMFLQVGEFLSSLFASYDEPFSSKLCPGA